MKLSRFRIEGFKALSAFDIAIPNSILFLIGSNGSGKTSILQSLSFIQYFAQGKSSIFFDDRDWSRSAIRSRIDSKSNSFLSFDLVLERADRSKIFWQFSWGLISGTNFKESIWFQGRHSKQAKCLFSYRRGRKSSLGSARLPLHALRTEGSVLALFSPKALAPENAEVLKELLEWGNGVTSLELLSPVAMRRGTRGRPNDIGPRGERLAGFLDGLDAAKKARLIERLSAFYPLRGIETTRKRAGWVDLRVTEQFRKIGETSAAHMSDGFLRILALCAIPEFDEKTSLILLDEVEDGIEPHILPRLIRSIAKESKAQLILTSHSPLLVNYFSPDEICFIARSNDGASIGAQSAQLPLFKKGSEFLGAGELWANSTANKLDSGVRDLHLAAGRSRRPAFDSVNAIQRFMDGT